MFQNFYFLDKFDDEIFYFQYKNVDKGIQCFKQGYN